MRQKTEDMQQEAIDIGKRAPSGLGFQVGGVLTGIVNSSGGNGEVYH